MGPGILHPPPAYLERGRRGLDEGGLRSRNDWFGIVRHSTCNARRSTFARVPNAANQGLHLVAIDLDTDVDLDATLRRAHSTTI